MADRVDAAMNPMQVALSLPTQHLAFAETRLAKLTERDHAVLLRGDFGDSVVRTGEFPTHPVGKSPGSADSPLRIVDSDLVEG
jgi:hypothetical protein